MSAVAVWVWFCAYLNCVGWALSAINQLNARGYAVMLALWFIILTVWRKKNFGRILPHAPWQRLRHRFEKPLPLAFLTLAAMAFIGGAIYPPDNYDALAYRIPRVLHWLAMQHWYWIHTVFQRVNTRACGMEWVSAPLIALLRTDRLLFLVNVASFLLLPGLVFTVFTRLGVRSRVAWHWMWVVPSGYCFLLQAGSIGNDLFGAVFALSAVGFALRARTSRLSGDFFTSTLAAALLTGSKTSNLPLLLPWALAILPSIGVAFYSLTRTFGISVIAVFASLLPTVILNAKFCGDWSGMRAEERVINAPVFKTGANVILITIENYVPPIFPLASRWNSAMKKNLPLRLKDRLSEVMEHPGNEFHLDELQIEERAGLGFGVSVLLLASVVAAFFERQKEPARGTRCGVWITCVRWSPVISLLALMAQSNLVAIARLLTPYYALLIPPLLKSDGHRRLVQRGWWRTAAVGAFVIAAGLLVVSPARPLFPAATVLAKMTSVPRRVREVYSVYRNRNDAFAPVRKVLPPDLVILGLVTTDDPETSLWRPFGSRRIVHLRPEDDAMDIKGRGVEYVLLKGDAFGPWFHETLEEWTKRLNAQVIQKIVLDLRASDGPRDWYLVKLN